MEKFDDLIFRISNNDFDNISRNRHDKKLKFFFHFFKFVNIEEKTFNVISFCDKAKFDYLFDRILILCRNLKS